MNNYTTSKYLKMPIHMHIGMPIVDCTTGSTTVLTSILDGRDIPVRLTLRAHDFSLLQEWEIPNSRPYSIIVVNNDFIIEDNEGRQLPGKFSETVTPAVSAFWHILEMRVTDPITGEYHAPYAVLITSNTARETWYHYCRKIGIPPTEECNLKKFHVHIAARNITALDAVGDHTISLARFLSALGINVQLYAHDFSPYYAGIISSVATLPSRAKANDIIFYQYSITDGFLEIITESEARRKILYYHGVTPSSWFRHTLPVFADLLDAARAQYPLFSCFDAVIANSHFSLEQIQHFLRPDTKTLIVPPYFSLERITKREEAISFPCLTRYKLLWVGRITPHKRPDLALKIFDELVKSGVDASLTFVGGGRYDFPSFAEHIDACLAALPAEAQSRVQFMQNISDEQLAGLYKHSDLLLCTSAHEGYCMPLAEAAACNLPVAATPQPAVLETLNGGGIILDENPPLAAQAIKDFLTRASEEERRAAIPVLKQLPTDELLRIVKGDT